MTRTLRAAGTCLPLILLVALVLRLGFARDYTHHSSRQALSVIPFLFEPGNIAYSLATGNGFGSPLRVETGPTAWLTPVYPALLAAIFRIFGIYTFASFAAAVGLNILFATLACVPVFYAGKRIAGLAVGAAAAWLWAVFPNAILIPVESLWDAPLAALLGATILWATLAIEGSHRWRDWCAYGLLWGLTLMTHPALGSVLPLLLVWLAYRAGQRRQGGQRGQLGRLGRFDLRRPALAAGVVILSCLPWTMRNYAAFHTLVPLRSPFGLSLWLGNNDRTADRLAGAPHPISDSAERAEFVELGEIEYMHVKEHEAIRYIVSNPGRAAHLMARRFVATWSGGSPYPVQDFLSHASFRFRGILLFNVIAALGALAGIGILARSRSPYLFPVAVFPLVYPLLYYLTVFVPRYRLPIDPMVLVLAAAGVAGWRRSTRRVPDAASASMSAAATGTRAANAASVPQPMAVSAKYAFDDQERMSKAKNYFAWLGRLVTPWLGRRVVEVGCGIGNFTSVLLDRELVVAVDREPASLARLKERYPRQSNLRTFLGDVSGPVWDELAAFQPDSYVCLNVLEHIQDDRRALAGMAAALAPGGVIVLLVPAFSGLYGPIDRNLGHHRRYTRESVRSLAVACGLRVQRIRFVNLAGFFGWWINARLLRREAQSEAQIEFFDRYVVPVMSWLEAVVPPPFGQSLLVFLEKP